MNKKIMEKFDNDIWYFSDYDIANDRINRACAIQSICFNKVLVDRKNWKLEHIVNENNIILLKRFVGHYITNTNHSISTITSRVAGLKTFLYYFDKINIEDITRESMLQYFEYLETRGISDVTFNRRVSEAYNYLEYLQREKFIMKNHIYRTLDRKNVHRKHANKTVSDFVINQIFSILDKIQIKYSIMFLILYSTGMRFSEVCQIQKGNTKQLDDGFFIEYYSTKMKKEVTNPISESLYKLIIDYEKNIEMNEEYLFNRAQNKPMYTVTFADKFNDIIEPFNIKDENDSPYKFRPHDYRHTLASQMAKRNIPPTVIQAILHHESEQMTYSYIDANSKDRVESFKKFVNYRGLVANTNTDTIQAEWLRENINAQILPNGLCSLPVKLGKCPHINSCLNCDYFYTSMEFIEVHKNQIEKTKELIRIAEDNNWIHQVNTNTENLMRLNSIVNSLERG